MTVENLPNRALKQSLLQLFDQIQATLTDLHSAGWQGLEPQPETLDRLARWGSGPPLPRTETLDDIRRDLGDCQRCPLAKGRTHIVYGQGSERASLVFVGEGPGLDEDRQGAPFVGPAGQLLTKIIGAMGLKRSQVYICNVVKCRPPENRNPLPDEIDKCNPFLQRQLLALQPKAICTLGAVASQTLLQTNESISRLRGRFHEYRGIAVMPTFHPAFLLRNPASKREVWSDMQQLMRKLGLPLP